MYETELFLKRILEQPDDDAPRLVFADWLEEQGDPRGEFIRLQCALANGSGGDADARKKLREREQSLRTAYGKEWAKPFAGIAQRCTFGRGFVEGITITAAKFLEHADDIFDWAPLRRIHLIEISLADGNQLASEPALAQVLELDLTANDLGDDGIERFSRSPYLSRLRSLHLGVNGLTDRSWIILACCTTLPSLQRLDLAYNHLRHLAPTVEFRNLKRLDLSHNECSIDALLSIPEALLDTLRIAGNPLGDEQSPLIAHRLLPQVVIDGTLDLSNCGLANNFAGALATTPHRRTIRSLKLEHNELGDRGLATLAQATGFRQLAHLQLPANGITDCGALALVKSEMFPQLAHLDLRKNQLSREGIEVLWSSERRRFGSILLLGDNDPPAPLEPALPDDAQRPFLGEGL